IEAAGCSLIYLPPYSPDLNPIEKFWANSKRKLSSILHLFIAVTLDRGVLPNDT
ncbi:MAG: transposase, partial [Puniceicoccales bacterium]|nr:transposase [Puniceicoccales bacterium]